MEVIVCCYTEPVGIDSREAVQQYVTGRPAVNLFAMRNTRFKS